MSSLKKNNFFKEIKFPSVFSNISYSEHILSDLSSMLDLSDELSGNILLSLSEAINNAIVHGNKFDPEKNVSVLYGVDQNSIILSVKDEGNGFDPTKIPDPTAPENIENLYGRGIFIIISLSDKVEFEYDNGQIVRMYFSYD